jgi:hypothetical protein
MDLVQKILKYILIFWFVLTSVPGMVSRNQFTAFILMSFGFAVIMLLMPSVLGFFKLPEKNISANILIGSLLTMLFCYICKPGILSLIDFPPKSIFGQISSPTSLLRIELNEFGIIVYLALISVIIVAILNHKEKK